MTRPDIGRRVYEYDFCNPHHATVSWCLMYRKVLDDKKECPLTCYYAKRMQELELNPGNLERKTEL